MVRTPQEWLAHPQGAATAKLRGLRPLILGGFFDAKRAFAS
jgi:hypothetical protein